MYKKGHDFKGHFGLENELQGIQCYQILSEQNQITVGPLFKDHI